MVVDWLTTLEERLADASDEQLAEALVSIAYVAGAGIDLDETERRSAARRALLLLAAAGDPMRGLDLDGRAVTALADDLETAERLTAHARSLEELAGQARGHKHVYAAIEALLETPDVAWRAYAAALLAEELGES
jgi:hypothetical protein